MKKINLKMRAASLLAGFAMALSGCGAGGGSASNAPSGIYITGATSTWSLGGGVGTGGTGLIVYPTVSSPGFFVPDQTTNPSIVGANTVLTVGPAYRASILGTGYEATATPPTVNNPGAIPDNFRAPSFTVMGHAVHTKGTTQFIGFASGLASMQGSGDVVEIQGVLNEFDNSIDATIVTKLSTLPSKFFSTTLSTANTLTGLTWVDPIGSASYTKGMLVKFEINAFTPAAYTPDPICVPPAGGVCAAPDPDPYSIANAALAAESTQSHLITKVTRLVSNTAQGVSIATTGYVNNYVSLSQFAVQGMIVEASTATISGGTAADIKAFAQVTVTGQLQPGGKFMATSVQINAVAPLLTTNPGGGGVGACSITPLGVVTCSPDTYVQPEKLRGL